MKLRLLSLSLLLTLSACAPSTPQVVDPFLSIEELEVLLKDADAARFNAEVSTAYSLFPIAFADSDGDGHGDLQGILQQIDTLNDGNPETTTDLGIDAIWLNPIHPSPTYHKYDVKDYYAIDPKFGTLEDFKDLVATAEARGIKIILDMVFNHSSSEHPWFLKALMKEEPYFDYYNIQVKVDFSQYPSNVGWNQKNGLTYFSGFWREMPEFNPDHPDVRQEFKNILDYWMDLGVHGFRFDAAKHMYDTNEYPKGTPVVQKNKQFWMDLRAHVKARNPDVFLIGEVWLDSQMAAPYVAGFDSIFNFDLQKLMVDALKQEYQSSFVSKFNSSVNLMLRNNPNFINATFLSNHDQERIMSQLSESMPKMRLGAHLLFTLPGTPFVYYGEELGMTGRKPDEQIREPFRWDGTTDVPNAMWEPWQYNQTTPPYNQQVTETDSLWRLYRDLIALRKELSVLRFGSLEAFDVKTNRILAYVRADANQRVLVVHNLSRQSVTFAYDETVDFLYQHGTWTQMNNEATLSPFSSFILNLGE